MEVDLTPIMEIGISLLTVVLSAVVAWVGKTVKKKFDIDIDTSKEGTLNRAIDRGMDYARKFATGDDGKIAIPVSNMMVKWAADYVIDKVPDTLNHFGITEERLREMIAARLPEFGVSGANPTAAPKGDLFSIPAATE